MTSPAAPIQPVAGPRLPDRSDPLPLWAQVRADLRRRIDAGEFAPGFPGELTLTEEYEVSRHTIREALRVLRNDGVLRSQRGRPTVIEPTVYRQSLGTLSSLFESVTAQGATPRSDVLRLAATVNASVSADLGLPADTELVVIERVRYADDQGRTWGTPGAPSTIPSIREGVKQKAWFCGTPAEVIDHPRQRRTQDFLSKVL